MKIYGVIVAAAFAGIAVPAAAQTQSTPRIDARQQMQERRIDQGVQSGALNKRETARLERGQSRVQKLEDKVTADGAVTRKERQVMEHAQDRQSRRIHRQKHDAQTAK